MNRWDWDPIRECEMSDPLMDVKCVGTRKDGAGCNNRGLKNDRESAYHQLELLAVQKKDPHTLRQKLEEIATLRLCRRRHRDQKTVIAEEWYKATCTEIALGQPLSARSHNGVQTGERWNPIDLTLATSSPDLTTSEMPRITAESLRRNQVPFRVSPASPARVTFRAISDFVTIRSIRGDCDVGGLNCCICHGTSSADETVRLECERCHHRIHLGCTEEWLRNRNPRSGFICPICQVDRAFDALYSSRETTGSSNQSRDHRMQSISSRPRETNSRNNDLVVSQSQNVGQCTAAQTSVPSSSHQSPRLSSTASQSLRSIVPTSPATLQEPLPRRSGRQRRAPVYYTP